MMRIVLLVAFVVGALSAPAYYTSWNPAPITEGGVTKYVGTINVNGVYVTVKYTPSKPVTVQNTGTNYLGKGSPPELPSPYTSSTVDNDPLPSNLVLMSQVQTNTLEFSQPVAGVVIAVVSINGGNSYVFDRDFNVLSYADKVKWASGYWGSGTLSKSVSGTSYSLVSTGEGHGALQLVGSLSTFTFSTTVAENWNGFTVAVQSLASEPQIAPWVYWTDWLDGYSFQNGIAQVNGNLNIASQSVKVKLTSNKALLGVQSSSGIDYWKSGSPNSPYTSKFVRNDPPPIDLIQSKEAQTITLEFSQPINGLVLAVISINGNTYVFNQDFTIFSFGDGVTKPAGYWGAGTLTKTVANVYSLSGTGEPHGAIGFTGRITSFSFTITVAENWNGFTIGTYGAFPRPQCVDTITTVPASSSGSCPPPSLYCAKLLNTLAQASQSTQQCTVVNSGEITFPVSTAGQRIYLSSDNKGTLSPYFDELAILSVLAPSRILRGKNVIAWQQDCKNTNFTSVTIPTSPITGATVDITSLFGNETGDFIISAQVVNKYTPFSNRDTWVCTGSSIPATASSYIAVTTDPTTVSSTVVTNGFSGAEVAAIAVGSVIGTVLLIAVVVGAVGYTVIIKKKSSAELVENLVN